jgi:surfactin synthase thioesterase subunit
LFASGTAGPARRDVSEYAHAKTDEQLIARLRELRGTAEEALVNPELMQLMLPILRADFLLCGSFSYGERAPLDMPIHVFGGKQDSVRADQLLDWQLEAASGFSLDMFDGLLLPHPARKCGAALRPALRRRTPGPLAQRRGAATGRWLTALRFPNFP